MAKSNLQPCYTSEFEEHQHQVLYAGHWSPATFYIVQSNFNPQLIKIGNSRNLAQRLQALQATIVGGCSAVFKKEVTQGYAIERYFQSLFKKLRTPNVINTEIFTVLYPTIAHLIPDLVETFEKLAFSDRLLLNMQRPRDLVIDFSLEDDDGYFHLNPWHHEHWLIETYGEYPTESDLKSEYIEHLKCGLDMQSDLKKAIDQCT